MYKRASVVKCHDVRVFENNLAAAVQAWKQNLGRREVRQPRERDTLCPDKVVAYGHRTIARDGSFRFANTRWQSDRLIPLAGMRVGVEPQDVHLCGVNVWTTYPGGKFLIEIEFAPDAFPQVIQDDDESE